MARSPLVRGDGTRAAEPAFARFAMPEGRPAGKRFPDIHRSAVCILTSALELYVLYMFLCAECPPCWPILCCGLRP